MLALCFFVLSSAVGDSAVHVHLRGQVRSWNSEGNEVVTEVSGLWTGNAAMPVRLLVAQIEQTFSPEHGAGTSTTLFHNDRQLERQDWRMCCEMPLRVPLRVGVGLNGEDIHP